MPGRTGYLLVSPALFTAVKDAAAFPSGGGVYGFNLGTAPGTASASDTADSHPAGRPPAE